MKHHRLDVAAIAIGLASLGFSAVLMLASQLSDTLTQPILAVILAAAGAIGLLLSRAQTRK